MVRTNQAAEAKGTFKAMQLIPEDIAIHDQLIRLKIGDKVKLIGHMTNDLKGSNKVGLRTDENSALFLVTAIQ